jgi:hypothetical protein
MTIEEVKKMLPIIQAYADGKIIEIYTSRGWERLKDMLLISEVENYRIKPEPEYIPFTVEDFNKFMMKEVKNIITGNTGLVTGCSTDYVFRDNNVELKYITFLEYYVFKDDGSPCGKLKE